MEVKKFSLIDELQKADKTLQGSPSLLGMTMLGAPAYVSSMRSTMFTSHLKQFLDLENPDYPYLFTNNENIVGKYSDGYNQVHGACIVDKIIKKYPNKDGGANTYKVFLFDKNTEKYEVVERKVCEDLTENFGYDYNNDFIDSLDEGDEIEDGSILYRSLSYDDDMNYGYGKNVNVAYALDAWTSEDAAVVSQSLCDKFTSIETETIEIGLNDNDFLINLYGNNKHYQPLPEIGQFVSDKLAVVRRQFNNQLLFDFKDSSLRKILEGDDIYYIDDNVQVIDYTVYCNLDDDKIDEKRNNPFYKQLLNIYDRQCDYYNQIIDECTKIMNSGYKYSRDINYLYKKACEMVDTKKKWKENDNIFNNMVLEVKIHRKVPLAKGCKITGRYGNKSVVSEIRPDEDMPYTHDGRRVDVLLNLLAIINRTTAMPLYEMFINDSSYKLRQKMKDMTDTERENNLFEYLKILNKKEADSFYKYYKKLNKKDKQAFLQDAIDNGIYIHQPPMFEDEPIFYRCLELRKKFPFIGEDDLYVRKWGREYKVLTKYVVGEMYLLKLKQSDRRGFSARSTGALNSKGTPARSFKSRAHLEKNSSSCIRFRFTEPLYSNI